jgi:hypothetical protein
MGAPDLDRTPGHGPEGAYRGWRAGFAHGVSPIAWSAWWGDCATLALEAVARDVPASVVRLLAGAPALMLGDGDLASLGFGRQRADS